MAYFPDPTLNQFPAPEPVEVEYTAILRHERAAQMAQRALNAATPAVSNVSAPELFGQSPGRGTPQEDIGSLLASLPKRGEPSRGSSRVLGDMLVNRQEYAPGTWNPGGMGMVSSETQTGIDPTSIAMRLRGAGAGSLSQFMPKALEASSDIMAGDRQRVLQEAQAERFRGQTANEASQEARLLKQLNFEETVKKLGMTKDLPVTPEQRKEIQATLLREAGITLPAAAAPQRGGFFETVSPGRHLWRAHTGKENLSEALRQQFGVNPNNPWTNIPTSLLGSLGERSVDLLALYGGSKLAAAAGRPWLGSFANMGKAAIPVATTPAAGVVPGLMSKLIGLFGRGRGAAQAAQTGARTLSGASPRIGIMGP